MNGHPPIEYVARVDLAQHPDAPAHRSAVPVTAAGVRAGFAHSVLEQRGFFAANTVSRERLGEDPRPLLTWPFLDFLAAVDLSAIDLVELGAGNSTLAFARMFRSVSSHENDARWRAALAPHLPSNAVLHAYEGDLPDATKVPVRPADWLVVDFAGMRTRFIRDLARHLARESLPVVVVLDNADWFRNGARLLREAGYTELPFFGFKSGQTWLSCTGFYFQADRLRLTYRDPFVQPAFSRPVLTKWDTL